MTTYRESIDIDLPIRTVYNQWTQFEQFPKFMEGVHEVRQLDDTRLEWVAEIAGQKREWEAKIVEQEPDRRIAWMSVGGATNSGVVEFESIPDDRTRVTLQIEFEPDDTMEKIGDTLNFVERRVQGDLERFKEFIEERGHETGAWRGEV
jgi:uncharacterized membrane protein